jgi:hypothetical protein
MSTSRRIYLLIHTPVELGRPVQAGFIFRAKWSNALFDEYKQKVEENRAAGASITHLSKRDVERWGFNPVPGPRYQVVDIEVPRKEWFEMWEKESRKELK